MLINITRKHPVTDATGARRTFGLGERDLADDLAQQLITARAAERVSDQPAPVMPAAVHPLGGGWYRLPDGSRVRGKLAARAASV